MPIACRRSSWLPVVSAVLLVACKGDGSDDTGSNTTTNATPATPSSNTDDTPTTAPTPTSTDDTGGTIGTSNVDATSNTASDPGTGTTQGVETVATTLTTDISTTTLSTGPDDTSTSLPGTDTTDTTDTSTTTLGDTTDADTSTGEPVILDIDVIITADNAYSFAYGTIGNIAKFFGGVEAVTAGQIFNCGEGPEKYVVPGADAQNATHLYIIAWDDSAVTNGVLARFRRTDGGQGFGEDVYTGYKGWQACATGLKYNIGQGGPTLAIINEYITKCNEGNLDPNTTSGGWVDEIGTNLGAVAFGEDNTTPYNNGPQPGNEFPLVCPMDMPAEAKWMWFDWDTSNPASPFLFPGGQNPYHQFLLFRLAAELIPEPQ